MFEIHPIAAAEAEKLARQEGLDSPVMAMNVWEDGEDAGYVVFRLQNDTVRLLCCRCERPHLAEWLIRAALNAAANRNAITAVCDNTEMFDLLRSLQFEEDGTTLTVFIPAFFNRPCGGCAGGC